MLFGLCPGAGYGVPMGSRVGGWGLSVGRVQALWRQGGGSSTVRVEAHAGRGRAYSREGVGPGR